MKKEYRFLINFYLDLSRYFPKELCYTIIDFIDIKGYALQKDYKITQCEECEQLTYHPLATIPPDKRKNFEYVYRSINLEYYMILVRGDHIWVARFNDEWVHTLTWTELNINRYDREFKENHLEIEKHQPINFYFQYEVLTEKELSESFHDFNERFQMAIDHYDGTNKYNDIRYDPQNIHLIKEFVKLIKPFISND